MVCCGLPHGLYRDTTYWCGSRYPSLPYRLSAWILVKYNSGLNGRLVADALEGFAPLFELEGLVDDTLGLDLAAIEIVNCGREHESFGEGAKNGDFFRTERLQSAQNSICTIML